MAVADVIAGRPARMVGMNASSPVRFMNRVVNVRPMVSLVSRFVGAGPNRLKMVRLWHDLDTARLQPESPAVTTIAG